MDQNEIFMMFPGIQPEELVTVQNIIKDMNDRQQQLFFTFYQGRRQNPQTLTLMTIIGFFGVAGIQRFMIGEIGMGILYLITFGFCGIGTIIDLVSIRKMTSTYNINVAMEISRTVRTMSP